MGMEENKISEFKNKKLTDEELENVSGGVSVIPKKDVIGKDDTAKPDISKIFTKD